MEVGLNTIVYLILGVVALGMLTEILTTFQQKLPYCGLFNNCTTQYTNSSDVLINKVYSCFNKKGICAILIGNFTTESINLTLKEGYLNEYVNISNNINGTVVIENDNGTVRIYG